MTRAESAAHSKTGTATDAAAAAPDRFFRNSRLEIISAFQVRMVEFLRGQVEPDRDPIEHTPTIQANLDGGEQAPAPLQGTLQIVKHETVHKITQRDDHQHDGDDLAHVVEVAAHHQQLSQADGEKNHLRLNQGAPS